MSLVNDARLVARGLSAAIRPPDAPWKLTCAVTWRCEQRCTHCRIWRRERSPELTAGDWRRVFASVGEGLSWLDLTGGEVTSRDDFEALARGAVEVCPHLAMLHFPTNGQHPDAVLRVARGLLGGASRDAHGGSSAASRRGRRRGPRLVVSVSLDGPRETHDRLRGDPGAFDAAVETFRRLRELGVETYFGMTLSDYTVTLVEETRQALADAFPGFQWTDLHVNLLQLSPHYFQNPMLGRKLGREAAAVAVAELVRRRGLPRHPTHLLEWLYQRNVAAHVRTGRSPVPCASASVNAFIDPEGLVYPCHIWDRPLARLPEHDLDLRAVWRLPVVAEVRREIAAERCPGCWTPCEAYPTVLAHLGSAALGALRQP